MSSTSPTHLDIVVAVTSATSALHTEHATLRCDGHHTLGTGFLRTRSKPACRLIGRGVLRRVARAQQSRRLCSQIYAGPQRAHITGTISGDKMDIALTRTDGCGTADWRKLDTLLGPPER